MDEWVSINYNAPNTGAVYGTAICPDASADLIDALYTALINELPFPLALSTSLVKIVNVDVKNITETNKDYMDITVLGDVGKTYLTPGGRVSKGATFRRREVTVTFI